jgi:hypothetical protein
MAGEFFTNTEVAVARGVERAVNLAATIEFATITAITGKTVTVNLADGTSVPNVNVLHPYVPRTGSIVRVASQGASLIVLGGLGVAAAVDAFSSNSSAYSVTATALSPLPVTPFTVAFVAPRSGAIACHMRVRLSATATARAVAGIRITTPAAVVVQSNSLPMLEVAAGGGSNTSGSAWRFSGLTPGTSYLAEITAMSGTAGQTITAQYPSLLVQPIA